MADAPRTTDPTNTSTISDFFTPAYLENRRRDNRDYDSANFRRLVRANYDRIDRPAVRRLADLIWKGAADEIERFIEIAPTDEPFPI